MSKINTTGKRRLVGDTWHDDNGPIPEFPLEWDPPMTDDEIHQAALSDPDNPPLTPEQLARFKPIPPAMRARSKLRMTREGFAEAFGIPLATLKAWERFEAEPSAVELAYLAKIEAGDVRVPVPA